MANIITELHLEMSANWYVSKKLNSVGRVGENTVTKLIIEPTEILDNVTYEIEIADASGSKNVAELTIDGTELYLILTANMLTVSGIMKMQVRGLFTDGSIKKSNIFELKVNRSISATEAYEEYAVTIFDQLVQDCRDIIEGAESYAVRAETAAVNAEAYEQSASASASTASTAATTATTASTTAVNAAASAESASTSAHTSAETATTAAASASTSASTAQTSAQTAQSASVTAQSASETAQTASEAATTAATSAENSASTATTAASNASTYADNAASSASNASNSATSATTAATNAATSETNAAASAALASTSAANANTSATNAANSAVAAATSATNAHNSEVNASTSETNASASATEAAEAAESVSASVAQINENTYRINDLEAIIGGYTLTDLPTGEIASITNGTALLMPSLKVGIEPAQDLHGYDHPWVGGAGKNLCPINNGSITVGDFVTFSTPLPGGTYSFLLKATRTPSSNSYTTLVPYDIDGNAYPNAIGIAPNLLDGSVVKVEAKEFNNGISKIYVYSIAGNWSESRNYTLSISDLQIEQGSTATSYEPYSNICPISGWTAANISVSPTTSAEDGTTYTIEFKDGDNPLTVYGGTLDATTGELVVDRAMLTIDNNSSIAVGGYGMNFKINAPTDAKAFPSSSLWQSKCNMMTEVVQASSWGIPATYSFAGNSSQIYFKLKDDLIDVDELKAFLTENPIKICYILNEPITYQLTPTQIRTLVGNNNIWADTGDIIEGKYYRSLT